MIWLFLNSLWKMQYNIFVQLGDGGFDIYRRLDPKVMFWHFCFVSWISFTSESSKLLMSHRHLGERDTCEPPGIKKDIVSMMF